VNPSSPPRVIGREYGRRRSPPLALADCAFVALPPDLLRKATRPARLQGPQPPPPAHSYRALVRTPSFVTRDFRDIYNDPSPRTSWRFVLASVARLPPVSAAAGAPLMESRAARHGRCAHFRDDALIVGVGAIGSEAGGGCRRLSGMKVRASTRAGRTPRLGLSELHPADALVTPACPRRLRVILTVPPTPGHGASNRARFGADEAQRVRHQPSFAAIRRGSTISRRAARGRDRGGRFSTCFEQSRCPPDNPVWTHTRRADHAAPVRLGPYLDESALRGIRSQLPPLHIRRPPLRTVVDKSSLF